VAFTTFKTWTAVLVTAPDLNEQIRDNGNILKTSILDDGHLYHSVIQSKTADYTIASSDDLILCTANSFIVTLPTAVSRAGRQYIVKNTGSGTITMASTSSQTIDGATASSTTLAQGDSLTFESTGSAWVIV
jgi:hypothetical protein